jgi:hypothetical protein
VVLDDLHFKFYPCTQSICGKLGFILVAEKIDVPIKQSDVIEFAAHCGKSNGSTVFGEGKR